MRLYMCPHPTIYVSSFYHTYVLILAHKRTSVRVLILQVAGLSAERADLVMMEAHTKGASSIATLPKSEAEALTLLALLVQKYNTDALFCRRRLWSGCSATTCSPNVVLPLRRERESDGKSSLRPHALVA
jgi:hypothetical protein